MGAPHNRRQGSGSLSLTRALGPVAPVRFDGARPRRPSLRRRLVTAARPSQWPLAMLSVAASIMMATLGQERNSQWDQFEHQHGSRAFDLGHDASRLHEPRLRGYRRAGNLEMLRWLRRR